METKPAAETVPLATFLDVKKDAKEVPGLKAKVAELEAKIAAGGGAAEVSADLAAIGEEFGVDPKFMQKLGAAVKAQVSAAKAEVEGELGTLREEKRGEQLDKAFRTHFDAAIEAMPEFKDIANADVIKTLSLDPKNANKTFSEIIEETYGGAIQGRRTIEPTVPRGGKEPEGIDYKRAATDTGYFNEIMADPVRKAAYNKDLGKRLKL